MIAFCITILVLSIGSLLFGIFNKADLRKTDIATGMPTGNWFYILIGIVGIVGIIIFYFKFS